MTIYVAYNAYGDLIADGYSYSEVLRAIEAAGYLEDECLIGRVTP